MMLRIAISILFIFSCFVQYGQSDSISSVKTTAPADSLSKKKEKQPDPEPPALGEVFKPKVSLGAGMMSFYGDLYSKHYQAPWTGRTGFDLNVSQRLSRSFMLNFNVLFGKLGANEWTDKRQQNFQSEIRSGGISLLYDFGNFIPERYKIRPWISAGVSSFEFLSKTDLYDNKGNKYYYWSDGSIKNMAEGSPGSQNAVNLVRDYRYETDIRELNADGFGKYREQAWAFPLGFGALMKVTDRVDLKIGVQYYFTTTDYIDGITSKSVGDRKGTRGNDKFVYTSFALQYDLVFKKREKMDTLPDNYFDNVDWLAIDNGDYDEDGVKDWDDKCQGTPKGAQVDAGGCPQDDDKDGVPNYADDELQTPAGMEVNMRGVALTDEYWQDWYNQYMDSTGEFNRNNEVVENFYAQKPKVDSAAAAAANEKQYTIELARYQGPVPAADMSYLLSIGDLKSAILSDNNTVVYTSGSFKDINNAVKKRDAYAADGNNHTKIGYFKNDDFVALSDEEIAKLSAEKTAANSNTSAATSTTAVSTNTSAAVTNTESAVTNTTAANTNTASATNTTASAGNEENGSFGKDDIVYRVQLGAYRHKISQSIFGNVGNVIEIESENGVFRYVTKGFRSINDAADFKANMVVEGYSDAFIAAYKNGKRIALDKTAATVVEKGKENLDDKAVFSSVNKDLISFKIQLGALRKAGDSDFEEKTKEFKDIEKQPTANGMIRYMLGDFKDYSKADKYREDLNNKGYPEAFVVAVFKGDIISIQEALELLK